MAPNRSEYGVLIGPKIAGISHITVTVNKLKNFSK